MENLNAITKANLAKRISLGNKQASAAVLRMVEEAQSAEDFILKLGTGTKTVFDFNESVIMKVSGNENYSLHSNAIQQLSEKFGIPARYLGSLATENGDWGKILTAEILNKHVANAKQDRFLIRAVNDEIRGVLSDTYKRLDSEKIMEAFISQTSKMGGVFASGFNNGLSIWLEVMNPNPIEIDTIKNGKVQIAFGARCSTSDFGRGAVDLRSFQVQGVCLNGMVRESVLRQVHLGSKLPDDLNLSRETIIADTKRTLLVVRDATKHLFSENYVREKAIEIQMAANVEVDMAKELEKLQKGGRITKAEWQETEKILLANKPEDGVAGESTLWKLTQGLTAMARTKDDERKRKIEEIAGELMPKVEKQSAFVLN